jgi:hypothetical protein
VATNSLGTSFGADRTFKTLVPGLIPRVTGRSPKLGTTEGGTAVTITGANFEGTTQVTFGGVEAASVVVDSSTQITAVSPAHAAGLVDIRVTTPNGTNAITTKDHYKYKAPA